MLLWASEIGLNLLVKDWIAAGPCETCITRDTIQTASRAETQGGHPCHARSASGARASSVYI